MITSPNGVITSPGYPSQYAGGTDCAWKIEAPEGARIRVIIIFFFIYFHLG